MGACCHSSPVQPNPSAAGSTKKEIQGTTRKGWFAFGLLTMAAGLVMVVTLAVNIDPPAGIVRTAVHTFLAILTGLSLLFFSWPILKGLELRRITLETLFLIGIIGAFGASIYSSITGVGHIYYEVVLVLLAIYRLGQIVSQQQVSKFSDLSTDIPGMSGRARVRQNGSETKTCRIADVREGDLVVIYPEEVIPIDGRVNAGKAFVEELPHTGEPFPVPRHPGDPVVAGARVLDGELEIEATSKGGSREIDRLRAALEGSTASHSERRAQKIISIFVPAVVTIAVITLIYWGGFAGDWRRGIFNALAVALVACPCGLGLAIPLAAKRGAFLLRLLGIQPQNGDFLESLSSIDTVVFDKTGTLSDGRLSLVALEVEPNAPIQIRSWLATIQRRSTHPVARPFWALEEPSDLTALTIKNLPARGIEATFTHEGETRVMVVANELYRAEQTHGCCSAQKVIPENTERRLYVFIDGTEVAFALLGEVSRESATSTMEAFTESGLKNIIITGDHSIPEAIAGYADEHHTSTSASEKAALIRQFRANGQRVLFLGDGLNDSEALQAADVSIALASGSKVAIGVSDAILEHGNLSAVHQAHTLAKKLHKHLHRLLCFVLTYNAIGIALAAAGLLHPVAAALLMLGSSVTVLSQVSRVPLPQSS